MSNPPKPLAKAKDGKGGRAASPMGSKPGVNTWDGQLGASSWANCLSRLRPGLPSATTRAMSRSSCRCSWVKA